MDRDPGSVIFIQATDRDSISYLRYISEMGRPLEKFYIIRLGELSLRSDNSDEFPERMSIHPDRIGGFIGEPERVQVEGNSRGSGDHDSPRTKKRLKNHLESLQESTVAKAKIRERKIIVESLSSINALQNRNHARKITLMRAPFYFYKPSSFDRLPESLEIFRIYLASDRRSSQISRGLEGRAGAEEGIEYLISRLRVNRDETLEQGERLLEGMDLLSKKSIVINSGIVTPMESSIKGILAAAIYKNEFNESGELLRSGVIFRARRFNPVCELIRLKELILRSTEEDNIPRADPAKLFDIDGRVIHGIRDNRSEVVIRDLFYKIPCVYIADVNGRGEGSHKLILFDDISRSQEIGRETSSHIREESPRA